MELTGTSEENKERLSSFLNNMMERGEQLKCSALPVQSRRLSKLLFILPGLAC